MDKEKIGYRRIIEIRKKRKTYFVILTLFWIYMVFIVYGSSFSNQASIKRTIVENTPATAEPVEGGSSVIHTFICEGSNLSEIEVGYYTYLRTNISTINVSLRDIDNDKILFESEVDCSKLETDETISYSFEQQNNSKGHEYEIRLDGIDGDADNLVSIHTLSYVHIDQRIQTVLILLWTMAIVVSYILTAIIKKADEKNFLIIAFVLGGIMIFTNPFTHFIDESTHFFRSFSIANGEWLDSISEDGKVGSYLPDNYELIVGSKLSFRTFFSNPNRWLQKFSKNDVFVENLHMASVLPINHSVAALGIFVARLIGLPAIGVIICSRIFPFLFYVACCYFAIKNVNKYKSLFFVVALLPTAIWLAASCSQDPVVNGLALLFTSICFKYKFNNEQRKVSKLDMVLILLCVIGIASVKYLVYTPLLLLFFLIPKDKMTPLEHKTMITIAIIIMLVFVILQFKMLDMFPFIEWGDQINPKEQLKYMLSSPLKAIKNITEYCVYNARVMIDWFSYVAESGVNVIAPLMGRFAVVVAPLLEQNRYKWNKKDKKTTILMFAFIIVVVTILVTVALYMGYTPVGEEGVKGVQPRYYLPIIVLVMILVSMLPIKNEAKNCDEVVPFICMLGLVDTLIHCIYS